MGEGEVMEEEMEKEMEEEAPPPEKADRVSAEDKSIQFKTHRLSQVRNKIRRSEQFSKLKQEKKKAKKKRQEGRKKEAEALGDAAPPKLVPKTLENTREKDETTVKDPSEKPADAAAEEAEDAQEVQWDICNDDFKSYFEKTYVPKVMITSTDNPHSKTISFMKELSRMIPNSELFWRKRSSIKKMVSNGIERGYTDVVVVNENNRIPNGMIVSHFPEGPTAHFRVSNVKTTRDIKRNWRNITSHRPEVILNNFTTRLGHSVGRMLASLFHYDPEFRGQRAVTFHNQRDYIFFRHHRYEFKNKERVNLRELGPRFTLKLRSLQKGTFDSKLGEYEWIITNKRHDLETSRRRFFL